MLRQLAACAAGARVLNKQLMLQECSAQAVSNILWAIAKRGMGASLQPPVLHTLLDASAQRLLALLPEAAPQVKGLLQCSLQLAS